MRIKSNISKIFSLIFIFLFTGCFGLKYKPHYNIFAYTDVIYGILKDNKVERSEVDENDIDKIERKFSKKYGIRFKREYNIIVAPKMYNKDYNIDTEFGKRQYIKFYDDIKVVIGEKEYIIPKEEIVLNDLNKEHPFYEYPSPIDIINSPYNDVIVDLGTVEIYDENGKIQKPKTKIPPVLIKKTYFVVRYNNIMRTDSDTMYRGWAEDLPPEKLKEYIEN